MMSPTAIIVGTSIEAGTGHAAGEAWPQQLARRAPGWSLTDHSKPGGAWTRVDEVGRSLRDHVREAVTQRPDVIVVGGPVNDLVSLADVGPLRHAVFEEVSAAKAAGIRVIVMGILPVHDGPGLPLQDGWWPNLEHRRATYNAWARDMYGPVDYVDLTWALRETNSTRGDRRWFRDGLHLTRVGAALVAEAFPFDLLEA